MYYIVKEFYTLTDAFVDFFPKDSFGFHLHLLSCIGSQYLTHIFNFCERCRNYVSLLPVQYLKCNRL